MLIRRIARPLLSVAFIGQGVDALRNPKSAADAARPALDGMRQLPDPVGTNVPSDPETFARINAAVQIGGGLLLATGKMPRVASAALAFTVIPGSLGGHMFWAETDPQRKADQRRAFMTDLSLLGGLIIAAVDTEGKPSLGWRGRRAARRVSEAVSGALPVGAASGGALADSAIAEKLGQGLHAARERGAELADVARDRAPELADAARERAAALAEIARERGPVLAEAARERAADFAEVARDRAPELAEAARGRAADFAEVARDRAPELAEAARQRAEAARERASDLADTAVSQTKKQTKKQRRRLS
jgi:uncharacterized membrane protein YphA (DoxX/SURF4 family)